MSDQESKLRLDMIVKDLQPGTQVYACGPDRLLSEIQALARDAPEDALHVEYFSSDAARLDPSKEHEFEVSLNDSNVTVRVPANRTLLETLHAIGVDVPCDCQEGLCGSCEVKVVAGEIDHRDRVLTRAERSAGNKMLVCCSRAKRNKLTLAL